MTQLALFPDDDPLEKVIVGEADVRLNLTSHSQSVSSNNALLEFGQICPNLTSRRVHSALKELISVSSSLMKLTPRTPIVIHWSL